MERSCFETSFGIKDHSKFIRKCERKSYIVRTDPFTIRFLYTICTLKLCFLGNTPFYGNDFSFLLFLCLKLIKLRYFGKLSAT